MVIFGLALRLSQARRDEPSQKTYEQRRLPRNEDTKTDHSDRRNLCFVNSQLVLRFCANAGRAENTAEEAAGNQSLLLQNRFRRVEGMQ